MLKQSFGCHVEFAGELTPMLSKNGKMMTALQFFMGAPLSFKRKRISDEDIASAIEWLKKREEERGETQSLLFGVFSHYPYIANLAGSKTICAWSGNDEQDSKTTALLKEIEYELSVLAALKSDNVKTGVVIHPGNHNDAEMGLAAIALSINKMNIVENGMLLLENTAGGGTSLCGTLEELSSVLCCVDDDKQNNVGICIDTCHIFAYGDYNISSLKEMKRLFSDFKKEFGIDRLKLIHLNDSEGKFKSRVDRHAPIGTGEIWGSGNYESLYYLLKQCKKYSIPVVLETCAADIAVVNSLYS